MKKIHVLESVRGFAAFYVLLHHLVQLRLPMPKKIAFFLSFGQEAVMLFFLLSGFVIYYSYSKNPQQDFKYYFKRRALRIFPIYLLSLLFTYLVACLNYKQIVNFNSVLSVGNFFMLQDVADIKPGVWFSSAGNTPLWSLAYEWWFYMMFFPVINMVKENRQLLCVGVISFVGFVSCLFFPNQIGLYLTYFIIWWMGVETAKIFVNGRKPTIGNLKIPLMVLGLFTTLMLANVIVWWKVQHQPLKFGIHPFLELRHFGFCLIILIFSLLLSKPQWKIVDAILRPFSSISPFSYALYVFHMPMAISAKYLRFLGQPALELIIYFFITFVAAYLAEVPLQRVFNRLK